MVRKKGPVWDHFEILSNVVNSHPHVKCKHCSKEYKRAVPGRMQAHLDKTCTYAPNSAKSQSNLVSPYGLSNRKLDDIDLSLVEDRHNLGYFYRHGIGTENNEIRASEYEKTFVELLRNLGYLYQHGIGTEKNEEKAFELYKEAANKGHVISINDLGYCYQLGIGTEKDEIKAFKLYHEAYTCGRNFPKIWSNPKIRNTGPKLQLKFVRQVEIRN